MWFLLQQELGLDGSFPDGTSGKVLQADNLAAALTLVNEEIAARYSQSKRCLTFADDYIMPDQNAEKFIREVRMKFEQPAEGAGPVAVTTPVLISNSKSEAQAAGGGRQMVDDPYMKRFLGNWYVKLMSVGQALEWVMLDCLRDNTPW